MFITLVIASSFFYPTASAQTSSKKKGRALIIYSGDEYRQGYNVADKIKFYLTHFDVKSDLVTSSDYSENLIGSYKYVFYLGAETEYLEKSLINDIARTKKKVFWINENVEQLGNDFMKAKGFEITRKNKTSNQVSYKDILLPKPGGKLNIATITNASKNVVYASAILPNNKKSPYIISSKNFFYIADNPFTKAKEASSYLAFTDILHNMVEDHPQDRKAVIRIDNINPKTDPSKLKTIIAFLHLSGHPFTLSVTPVYKKSAKSKQIFLRNNESLVDVLKDAEEKGASIALNGYSHQRKKETGNDVEFGSKVEDKSSKTTEQRVKSALNEMKKAGLKPIIWHTPYYQSTQADQKIFSKYFKNIFERGTEPPPPYFVKENNFDQKVIPENLGSVTNDKAPFQESIPERAWRMQVVRDAHAGFAIQTSISMDELVKTIRGVEDMGYEFVSPYFFLGIKHQKPKKPFFGDRVLYDASLRTENLMQSIGWALLPLIFITYYIVIFGLSRRIRPKPKKNNSDLFFIFVVPALNEEKVIRKTLEKLVALPQKNFMVLAMNDNSSDNTEAEMRKVKSNRLQIHNRRPPHSQQGKGAVLNEAYNYILSESGMTKTYPVENLIIAIVDSDGGVDPHILPSVAPYFEEAKSASVQTAVRIQNRDQNIWTKWQEFEFGVFTYLFQSAREQLGSVGLGGNGQFIRFSALKTLGEAPWTKCLTEDLDIGIRLILKGFRNHFCPTSYVDQQAVPKFWPLVKQRTRWFQGHVQCWRHLGRIAINRLPVLAKVDITYYLLSISLALVIVPANFIMLIQAAYLASNPDLFFLISSIFGTKIYFYWYFLYFGAMPIFTYCYWRAKKQSLFKAIVFSHLFLFVSLVWLIAGYLAIFRLFRKTTNWHKTER